MKFVFDAAYRCKCVLTSLVPLSICLHRNHDSRSASDWLWMYRSSFPFAVCHFIELYFLLPLPLPPLCVWLCMHYLVRVLNQNFCSSIYCKCFCATAHSLYREPTTAPGTVHSRYAVFNSKISQYTCEAKLKPTHTRTQHTHRALCCREHIYGKCKQ